MVPETERAARRAGAGWEQAKQTRGESCWVSGVAQSEPAGSEGVGGRGTELPAIWGSQVGLLHVGWHVLGSTGMAGRPGSQAGAHSAPALLTDTMPPGVGTTVIPFDDGKTEAPRGKETC